MTRLNKHIVGALNKKRLGIYKQEKKTMKNWQHIRANDNHGHYIEDVDTGRTVCDLYIKIQGYPFTEHDDAEEHARLIVEAPMMRHLLERISAVHSGRQLPDIHGDLQDRLDDVDKFLKRLES